jgi:hypothetical protein
MNKVHRLMAEYKLFRKASWLPELLNLELIHSNGNITSLKSHMALRDTPDPKLRGH